MMTDLDMQDLRVSLTNVSGLGASELASSLLPALETLPGLRVGMIYLPSSGRMAGYSRSTPGHSVVYRRYLPKALSRIAECTVLGDRFDGPTPLLVLGDLPIRTCSPQVVFVQSPHIVRAVPTSARVDVLRYRVARLIFRLNLAYVEAFIVQTEAMRVDLLSAYPIDGARVHVLAQPSPAWLLGHRRQSRSPVAKGVPLQLFYPAAFYPHKNHRLLARISSDSWTGLVERLILTIEPDNAPMRADWLVCTGRLAPDAMIGTYEKSDALLFLSKAESYGFPLVEAMWLGLPIICPALPYGIALCGSEAIYFDPDSAASLIAAVRTLRTRLDAGWSPDWRDRLRRLPENWSTVAAAIATIIRAAAASVARSI